MKSAIDLSDGVIIGSEQINSEIADYLVETGKLTLPFQTEEKYIDAYNSFYEQVLTK
jgi:starch synthase